MIIQNNINIVKLTKLKFLIKNYYLKHFLLVFGGLNGLFYVHHFGIVNINIY